jgi:GTPase SAR1 family protein
MSTKYWLATRLIWTKVKGLCLLREDKHLLMNMASDFFETSAKTNLNVEQVFFSIARDIKQRLAETDSKPEDKTIKINKTDGGDEATAATRSACCGS